MKKKKDDENAIKGLLGGNLVTDLLRIFAHDLFFNLIAQGPLLISVTHLSQKGPWKHLKPLRAKEINE